MSEFDVKDILSLVLRDTLSGEERIPVSDAEYITVQQLVTLVATLGNISLIKSNDTTTVASNKNAFSALCALSTFLRKDANDSATGLIKFLGGLEVGKAIDSMSNGKGIVAKDGRIQLDRLEVRESMEVMEMIINRISAMEGDQVLTEGDSIEKIDYLGDNCYGLHLKHKWEGYFTAQSVGSVIKGTINTLASGSGDYYTSWMRINFVNAPLNYIEVALYSNDEVPGGENYQPCELMKIVRWGHQTDKTRQSCLYFSSSEGRIIKLTGVKKPILESYNYGATFGSLPDFLKSMDLPIVEDQDYAYMRGLIVEDIIRLDYQGKPISEIVDRGEFIPGASYYCEGFNPATNSYETSAVWHRGCKYHCAKNLTTATPRWNTTDWVMVEGNPDFEVDLTETDGIYDPDTFDVNLNIIATLYNQDITSDVKDIDVVWSRYSQDNNGNERPDSDTAWAIKNASKGKELHLTRDDCDFNGYIPKRLKFTATVTLRDDAGNAIANNTITFGY